ncbi:MAG: hypothetical protein WCC26_05620 [Terracidiphilus sp.]
MPEKSNKLIRLLHWASGHFVQEVPEDLAVCEFACRHAQCTQGEWETCERRLTYMAGQRAPANKEEAG